MPQVVYGKGALKTIGGHASFCRHAGIVDKQVKLWRLAKNLTGTTANGTEVTQIKRNTFWRVWCARADNRLTDRVQFRQGSSHQKHPVTAGREIESRQTSDAGTRARD